MGGMNITHKDMQLDYLAVLVESVTGYAPLTPRRSRPVVESRALLACVLLAQGHTLTAVGDEIGWNHATVSHYRTMLDDALRYGTRPEMARNWAKLKNILDL